jgi:hypothetical protein
LEAVVMVEALRRLFGSSSEGEARHLTEEIRGFGALNPGWNSYRAPKVTPTAIKNAVHVVELVARRHATLPSASPTPLGGVALSWDIRDTEVQLLIDDESFEYTVARRGHPKVIDQGSLTEMQDVEHRLLDRYVVKQ